MKQKLSILAMVVLAAIFIASPVLAAGSSRTIEVATRRTPTIISMTATILVDDVNDRTNEGAFTVRIRMTNRAFIEYRGEVEEVLITNTTKCVAWSRYEKSKSIDCSSLDKWDNVSINAKLNLRTEKFTARRVTIKQPRIPE